MSAKDGGHGGTSKPVQKIRGHTGSILCCTTSRNSPDEVITSSEDGSVRIFDLRSNSCSMKHQCFGGEPVASVSVNPGNATQVYVAAGAVVYSVDLRLGSSGRELQRYDFNLDEINQVVANQKGSYVAAADDSGEIKVIDVHNCKLYRTLRGVHTNVSSYRVFSLLKKAELYHTDKWKIRNKEPPKRRGQNTCQMEPPTDPQPGVPRWNQYMEDRIVLHQKPARLGLFKYAVQFNFIRKDLGKTVLTAVVSGGLDSKIIKWDFSKGKELRSVDLVAGDTNAGQLWNPPYVHALAIPEGNGSGDSGRVVAVARGDGVVEVYDLSFENEKSLAGKGLKNKRGNHQSMSSQGEIGGTSLRVNGLRCHFSHLHGGHSSAVSSVAFIAFGEKDRFLVSGGNDKCIRLWNWRSSPSVSQSDDGHALLNIQHGKKINWLSTIDRNNGNLLVADTSRVLSVYHIL